MRLLELPGTRRFFFFCLLLLCMAKMARYTQWFLGVLVAFASVPCVVNAELSLIPNERVCSASSPADEGYISFCHGVITCPDFCPRCKLSCKFCGMSQCPRCGGGGSICEDPKFIGGDGVMFYFHGQKDRDFCIISDHHLHVNAHFIGKRTPGRPRDFTWVQALAFMWGANRLYVGARHTATWNDRIDRLVVYFNDDPVNPPPYVAGTGTGGSPVWRSPLGGATITRTAPTNAIRLEIPGLMAVLLGVVPITAEDSRVHGYDVGPDDCFAHLEIAFDSLGLSEQAAGILGQTYTPGFINPVKRDIPMPILGGAHRFISSSLFSSDCLVSRFTASSAPNISSAVSHSGSSSILCGSDGVNGLGLVCRK